MYTFLTTYTIHFITFFLFLRGAIFTSKFGLWELIKINIEPSFVRIYPKIVFYVFVDEMNFQDSIKIFFISRAKK